MLLSALKPDLEARIRRRNRVRIDGGMCLAGFGSAAIGAFVARFGLDTERSFECHTATPSFILVSTFGIRPGLGNSDTFHRQFDLRKAHYQQTGQPIGVLGEPTTHTLPSAQPLRATHIREKVCDKLSRDTRILQYFSGHSPEPTIAERESGLLHTSSSIHNLTLCTGPSGRRTTAALATPSAARESEPPPPPNSSHSHLRSRPTVAPPPLYTSSSSPPSIPPPSYSTVIGSPDQPSPPPSPSSISEPSLSRSNTASNSTGSTANTNIKPKSPEQILLSRKRLNSTTQHPRVAAVLGVKPRWYVPLLICRALSCVPAAWWGFRCALTFLGELILRQGRGLVVLDPGVEYGSGAHNNADIYSWSGGGAGVGGRLASPAWVDAERRFRVTEVFLAMIWCSVGAYLSFFFTDCLMTRWLVNYTPFATVLRLLTLNALIAYISSLSMWLSGASEDPRMLLPAWMSIASLLTVTYHVTQRKINIKKETHASINVFSFASFVSLCAVLFQLHLTRENDPVVPIFEMAKQVWRYLHEYLHIGQDIFYEKAEL